MALLLVAALTAVVGVAWSGLSSSRHLLRLEAETRVTGAVAARVQQIGGLLREAELEVKLLARPSLAGVAEPTRGAGDLAAAFAAHAIFREALLQPGSGNPVWIRRDRSGAPHVERETAPLEAPCAAEVAAAFRLAAGRTRWTPGAPCIRSATAPTITLSVPIHEPARGRATGVLLVTLDGAEIAHQLQRAETPPIYVALEPIEPVVSTVPAEAITASRVVLDRQGQPLFWIRGWLDPARALAPVDHVWPEVVGWTLLASLLLGVLGLGLLGDVLRGERRRRRAEQAQQQSETLYRSLVESSLDLIWRTDETGRLTFVNRAAEKVLGYDMTALLGRRFTDLQDPEIAARDRAIFDGLLEGWMRKAHETTLRHRTGEEVHLVVTGVPLRDPTGRIVGVQGTAHDITRRTRSERELLRSQGRLRSLSRELASAEAQERRHLASELHDQVGQLLVSAKLGLSAVRVGASPEQQPLLAQGIEQIGQAIQAARNLTYEISPPILYELGLERALEWLGERYARQHGFAVAFTDDGQPKPLPDDVRAALFKSARELLVNVVKHAAAKRVALAVRRGNGCVRIEVHDDGKGFPADAVDRRATDGGFGLFSIRERLEGLGGGMLVTSAPGEGTVVTLVAPLATQGTSASSDPSEIPSIRIVDR